MVKIHKDKGNKMNMNKTKKIRLTPTQTLVVGIILIILLGAILLKLPISNNRPISFLDSLFVATSSVCVTGLTTVVIAEQFSMFRTGNYNDFSTNRWTRFNELSSVTINGNKEKNKFIRQISIKRSIK